MDSFKVRYSKPFSILLLIAGALIFAGNLATGRTLMIVVGGILVLVSILFLVNPMVVIANGEVQMRNALGMTLKRYPVRSPADLRADDRGLWHLPTGKKITHLRFGIDKNDAEALRTTFTGQPHTVPQGAVSQGGAPNGQPPQGMPRQGGAHYGQPPQGFPPQDFPQQGIRPPQGRPSQG